MRYKTAAETGKKPTSQGPEQSQSGDQRPLDDRQRLDEHDRLIAEQGRQIDDMKQQISALTNLVDVLRRLVEIHGNLASETLPAAPSDPVPASLFPASAPSAKASAAKASAAKASAAKPSAAKASARTKGATIYCDGGCWNNPGPGGWACIVEQEGEQEEFAGARQITTNNQMELQALIEGLKAVPAGTSVEIVTDSEYLVKGVTSWLKGWARNGWMTAAKQPVKNRDQWQEVLLLLADRPYRAEWVKGHAGHPENERCDKLAQAAIKRLVGARK